MITTVAKAKFFIGTTTGAVATAAASTDAAILTAYEADTYVEVKEVSDLGEFGDEAEEIKFSSISDARVRKLKGTRDAGTMEISVGRDAADPGQVAMRVAKNDDYNRNYKIVLNDAPVGGTPTTFFFRGLITKARTKTGEANNVVIETFSVGINSAIVEVPADEA